MAINTIYRGTPFSVTATGSTSASASFSCPTGSQCYITDIAASSDKAGAIVLAQQGSTTLWQVQMATTAAGNNSFQEQFESSLLCPINTNPSVSTTGTSVCCANIAGYYL